MRLLPQGRLRRAVAILLGAPLALFAAAALAAFEIVARGGHASAEAVASTPVAIVFGAGLRADGQPMFVLEDRLATAVDLYRTGKVRKLLLSGDHGRRDYDETAAMCAYVERAGVPPADVFLDHAGFDTYATLYRARDVFGVRSALLVTQRFHLPRALYIARGLGLAAAGVESDRHRYAKRAWFEVREVGARLKAVLWIELLRPAPRYLGPPIPIEGDGRVTRDERARGNG